MIRRCSILSRGPASVVPVAPLPRPRSDCSLPRAQFDRNVAQHNAALQALLREFPAVQLFDAAAQLCDAQRCHVMLGDKLMYRDTQHLSYDGDLYMGQKFAAQRAAAKAAR